MTFWQEADSQYIKIKFYNNLKLLISETTVCQKWSHFKKIMSWTWWEDARNYKKSLKITEILNFYYSELTNHIKFLSASFICVIIQIDDNSVKNDSNDYFIQKKYFFMLEIWVFTEIFCFIFAAWPAFLSSSIVMSRCEYIQTSV